MSSHPVRYCDISDQPLSVDRVVNAVRDRGAGAVVTFLGVVRDHDGGQQVISLDYSAHPRAAEAMDAVARDIGERHQVIGVGIEHRTGHLEIGDLAVVIAVSAAHRGDAFAACRDAIDTLKTTVPIWKRQVFGSGEIEWVGLP